MREEKITTSGHKYIIADKSHVNNNYEERKYVIYPTVSTCSYITIDRSPTGNCQLASIGYFNYILTNVPSEHLNSFIVDMYKLTCKKNILIDVSSKYCKIIEELFGNDYIMVKTIYRNTYIEGNEMCLYMIKLRNWLIHKELISSIQ